MGGGPDKETLVFIFMFDEPKHITDDIRRKFPHIEVIYHQLGKAEKGKTMGGISYAFDTIPEGNSPPTKSLYQRRLFNAGRSPGTN